MATVVRGANIGRQRQDQLHEVTQGKTVCRTRSSVANEEEWTAETEHDCCVLTNPTLNHKVQHDTVLGTQKHGIVV